MKTAPAIERGASGGRRAQPFFTPTGERSRGRNALMPEPGIRYLGDARLLCHWAKHRQIIRSMPGPWSVESVECFVHGEVEDCGTNFSLTLTICHDFVSAFLPLVLMLTCR